MPFILGGFRMFFFQCIYFWQIIFYFFCLSAQFGCSFFILGFSTFSESVLKNKNIIIFISYSLFFFSENYFWESKTSFLFLTLFSSLLRGWIPIWTSPNSRCMGWASRVYILLPINLHKTIILLGHAIMYFWHISCSSRPLLLGSRPITRLLAYNTHGSSKRRNLSR